MSHLDKRYYRVFSLARELVQNLNSSAMMNMDNRSRRVFNDLQRVVQEMSDSRHLCDGGCGRIIPLEQVRRYREDVDDPRAVPACCEDCADQQATSIEDRSR